MKKTLLLFVVFALLLAACNPTTTPSPDVNPTTAPTQGLPEPSVNVQDVPNVEDAATVYLDSWKIEDYPAMYAQLSRLTRDALSEEDFTAEHKQTAIDLTLKGMDYALLSNMLGTSTAQVSYRISYDTNLMGTIERDTIMHLILEEGAWHVQWDTAMLLPELANGNYLELVLEIPARGNIYSSDASNNYPLVAQEDAVTLQVVPGRIDPATEDGMVSLLAELTYQTEESVRSKYEYTPDEWAAIIGDATAEEAGNRADQLDRYSAIQIVPFKSRYYYDGGIAPHVTGYVLPIGPENQERYQRLGYSIDESVGATGLELWGEKYLAGTHGADLYVKDPAGQIVTRIASVDAKPAQSIYTTIDSRLQYWLQRSMGDMVGAVVVMERDTSKVIAMTSGPGFDPNVFNQTTHTSYELAEVTSDPLNPLYNRATQGVYPPGSVFKMVTMAAALETGVFTEDYPYLCDSLWTELDGWVGKDWTYDKGYGSSGVLTLQQGLMRSCNPWFWHIAYTLWNDGYRSAIYDLSIGFGLGSETGIEIPEFKGKVDMPQAVMENVQMGIGQSTLQVSALQVANYTAAIGNGGTLYRPTVIDRIAFMGQDPVYTFEPEVLGQLPVTPENLASIQEAMVWVIRNPSGTAEFQFDRFSGNIAGKTGTAENPAGESHAWFTAYTFNEDPNKPDIVVTVILENAGEGSEMAAPLARRAIALYYSNADEPGGTMPWEARPYIPSTPEPTEE